MTNYKTCGKCGVVNNIDEYLAKKSVWDSKPQMMYMTNPPSYANPPPDNICTNCGKYLH